MSVLQIYYNIHKSAAAIRKPPNYYNDSAVDRYRRIMEGIAVVKIKKRPITGTFLLKTPYLGAIHLYSQNVLIYRC